MKRAPRRQYVACRTPLAYRHDYHYYRFLPQSFTSITASHRVAQRFRNKKRRRGEERKEREREMTSSGSSYVREKAFYPVLSLINEDARASASARRVSRNSSGVLTESEYVKTKTQPAGGGQRHRGWRGRIRSNSKGQTRTRRRMPRNTSSR